MRKIALCCATAALLALGACNTIAGFGKDASAAGHAVTQTAEDAKPK